MRRAIQHTPPATDRERIIELFAQRQPAYTRADVTRLLGLTDEEFEQETAGMVFRPEPNDRGMAVFRWEDVAHLALERWTPRMIEAALGTIGTMTHIPLLNQHRLIRISLPIYLIQYLHHRALHESSLEAPRNASDIIEAILHNEADTAEGRQLEPDIPGFARALEYPYYTPLYGTTYHRCRYCDTSITEPAREVCKSCEQRHEPKEHLGEYGIPELEDPKEADPPQPTARQQRKRRP